MHRIGRTARAGAEGDAISLGCEDFVQSLPDIESYIGRRIPVASVTQELLAEITVPHRERRRFGGPGGASRGGGPVVAAVPAAVARGGGGGGYRGNNPRGGSRSGSTQHVDAPATAAAMARAALQDRPQVMCEPRHGGDGARLVPVRTVPKARPWTSRGLSRKRRRRGGRGRPADGAGDGPDPVGDSGRADRGLIKERCGRPVAAGPPAGVHRGFPRRERAAPVSSPAAAPGRASPTPARNAACSTAALSSTNNVRCTSTPCTGCELRPEFHGFLRHAEFVRGNQLVEVCAETACTGP